uniref:FAD-linked oxidase C-terminal domain-containing protein n=1 Tax=Delftia acidovorans TaxID=80866 RepID=UPI00359F9257
EEGAAQGVLYLRLRGARAAVQAACERLGGERMHSAAADWQACREHQLPWFTARAPGHAMWRLSVPQRAPALALPDGCTGPLIEWHGALRWVQAPRALGHALRALAKAAGGSATLFRSEAAGQPGAEPDFDAQAADATAALHARLKQAFDPAGIFNRGRLAAAW